MIKRILIFGAGGMAREVADLIRDLPKNKYEAMGFVDKDSSTKNEKLNDLYVLGGIKDLKKDRYSDAYYSCGFGEINLKKKTAQEADSLGLSPITLIHPKVLKTPYVEIGDGSIICAGTIMTNKIKIGRHVLVNVGVTIGHDSQIGDFSTISPGVHISGRVKIGQGCYIGTGAVILPNMVIGDGAVVGAGAVVNKDVPSGWKVVGVPAKKIEKRK